MPILKRLRATLLRSFRGLYGEKMVCVRGVLRVTGTLGKANSHFDPTQTGRQPTTTLRRLLIGAVQFCSLYMYILYIRQKFRTLLSQKIGVNTCFEDGVWLKRNGTDVTDCATRFTIGNQTFYTVA